METALTRGPLDRLQALRPPDCHNAIRLTFTMQRLSQIAVLERDSVSFSFRPDNCCPAGRKMTRAPNN